MSENNKDNGIQLDVDTKNKILLEKKEDYNNNINDKNESLFMKKFKETFLNMGDNKKKKKRRNSDDYNNLKFINDEFINKNINIDENSDMFSNVSDYEELDEKANALDRFKSAVKKVIHKKKTKEWKEFMESYVKDIKENIRYKYIMKNIFNIKSDLMVIWKVTFSAFSIVFVFIYFLKYILIDLSKQQDDEEESSKKIIFLYNMINLMFIFELILSILIIIFNGGSIMTYIKLPLKIYNAIPFALKRKNIYLLVPKFFRLDLFEKLFNSIEMFINSNVTHYVHNYYLKIFITYTNDMFKYLLVFGFYAHCLSCLFYFFEEKENEIIGYIPCLYYNIQTFTTIGFGELSPKNIFSLLVMILTLFLGVNFMSVITSNIRYLSSKIKDFNRETSFNEQFEFLIFRIQKSTGKVFPSHLKKLMSLFLLFRRGIAYYEIKENNKRLFDTCRNSIVTKIHRALFNYLKEDFSIYFYNCEDEFIYKIFECMRPKMFKANKTLVDYNKNVKGLYFLINGSVFIYNKNKKPVYSILGNSLFGEYEFISNTKTNYSIKVHPRMAAYGFVLKQSDWEKISKQYVKSANKFFETIILRKKKHNEWILNSLIFGGNNENIINEKNNRENSEPSLMGNLIDNPINNSASLSIRKEYNKKKSDKSLIILAQSKNEKYDINSQDIMLKIDDIRKNLDIFENNLIKFKKDIYNIIKIKHF